MRGRQQGEDYNNKIRSIDRKGIDALAIRGISDHADAAKDQLETSTSGHIRAFAAGNAAMFLRLQIGNPHFKAALSRTRPGLELDLGLPGAAATQARPLTTVLADFAAAIDKKLREFSPEYKLLEKGYRQPASCRPASALKFILPSPMTLPRASRLTPVSLCRRWSADSASW